MKSLYGLHLWAVSVSYRHPNTSNSGTKLWITTAHDSIVMATKKTHTFLRHHRDWYPKAKITAVESHGFIDA
jgi:hypothetical protein